MKGFVVPLLCVVLAVVPIVLTLTRGDGVRQVFPDIDRRPPLRVVTAFASSQNANDRLLAAQYLGYYRSEEAFAALVKGLSDGDMLIRMASLRSLAMQGDSRAIPEIERVRAEDDVEIVRHRADLYLESMRYPLGRLPWSPSYEEEP